MTASSLETATSARASTARLGFTALAPGGFDPEFGVEVDPGPASELSESEFAELERAVYTHQVVVLRGQGGLTPRQQFELTRRFDPLVKSYGHGNRDDLMKKSVLTRDLVSIPEVPQVKLLGNGRVYDHEGIAEADLLHPSPNGFHARPPSAAEEARDRTRFYRWHLDAALYDLNPPKVTTLLALQVPEDRRQTVEYADGSGDELEVSLGTTAFVSAYAAFERLSPEQRAWARRARVRYAPHPYIWMRNARSLSNGLGLLSEGRELSRAELPPVDDSKVMTLPLVWLNEVTGREGLMVHAYCVEELFVDGVAVGDLIEVRRLLHELMRPAIAPERVYAHAWRSGDLVIFHNRGVWHSVVGALAPTDVRVYHQCNLASTEAPRGVS